MEKLRLRFWMASFVALIKVAVIVWGLIETKEISQHVQEITVSALWLPAQWRHAVEFLSVLVALIFATFSTLSIYWIKRKYAHARSIISGFLAVAGIFGAGYLFWDIHNLSDQTIRPFNQPAEWWQQQLHVDLKQNSSLAAMTANVPDFINLENSRIFAPLEFADKDFEAYLRKLGQGDLSVGIDKVIDEEPMKLVSITKENAQGKILQKWQEYFFLLHLGLMACIGLVAGILAAEGDILFDEKIEKMFPELNEKPESRLKHNRSMPNSPIIPELLYPDVRAATSWLADKFGFVEHLQQSSHGSQMFFNGGAIILILQKELAHSLASARPVSIIVRVEDVHEQHERAKERGVAVSEVKKTASGERQFSATDLAGHQWIFTETTDDVDPTMHGWKVRNKET